MHDRGHHKSVTGATIGGIVTVGMSVTCARKRAESFELLSIQSGSRTLTVSSPTLPMLGTRPDNARKSQAQFVVTDSTGGSTISPAIDVIVNNPELTAIINSPSTMPRLAARSLWVWPCTEPRTM